MTDKLTALIGNVQKFSTEDGPGVRTTVFLKGCPLNCSWCHNPETIKFGQQMIINPNNCIGCGECIKACPNEGILHSENGPEINWALCNSCQSCAKVCFADGIVPVAEEMSVDDVMHLVVQDKTFYKETGGGVTLSGGECLAQPDFAEAIIKACSAENISICLDTSGYANYDVLERLCSADNVEYVLYDMKHIDKDQHTRYTGVDNTLILDNLRRLSKNQMTSKKIWMRMPLINDVNDDKKTIFKTSEFYKKYNLKRVTLIAYHSLGESKRRRIGERETVFEAPPAERFMEIKNLFEEQGMKVDIIGVN